MKNKKIKIILISLALAAFLNLGKSSVFIHPALAELDGAGVVIPEDTGLADPPGGIAEILSNLLFWLLAIVGIIALIGFVISGIQYIISAGDEKMMETAKRNMMYSIAGVTVALAGVVIINAINAALEAQGLF